MVDSDRKNKKHRVKLISIIYQFPRHHTFPPEAQSDPSGDIVTVFMYPECPIWFVFKRQVARFHT